MNETLLNKLFERQFKLLQHVSTDFIRSVADEIAWHVRLVGIRGVRGVGKTTLLLQYIKKNLDYRNRKVLYVSMDHILLSGQSLYGLAATFVRYGGKHLLIDEIHHYRNWHRELKNIYDDFPELQTVFTGSSLLNILDARADLSRRALMYRMQGLSFREFLALETGTEFPVYSLQQILENHREISMTVLAKLNPMAYFKDYLTFGYFPFFREYRDLYHERGNEMINFLLELELPMLRQVDLAYIPKIKQLLGIIAVSVPFTPQITALSRKIGINRLTLLKYLHYLAESELIITLYRDTQSVSLLQKPAKIYLENTNYMYAFSGDNVNPGNIRETFFVNQLRYRHKVALPARGDFRVDGKWLFETGGRRKSSRQIQEQTDAFVVADDTDIGYGNKIPLWMFGFLY